MIEIDEIISNAEYCADVYERMNKAIHPALQVSDYKRYAEDHGQLAEWLKDYKRLKEQEPCDDAISRAQAIYVASGYCHPANVARELEKLPSVKPAEIKEPCEDCISRQAVIELAKKGALISNRNYESVCKAINALPPVTPQSKTGYWIDKHIRGSIEPYCSVCGDSVDTIYHYNYCPNCGAKMKEAEE